MQWLAKQRPEALEMQQRLMPKGAAKQSRQRAPQPQRLMTRCVSGLRIKAATVMVLLSNSFPFLSFIISLPQSAFKQLTALKSWQLQLCHITNRKLRCSSDESLPLHSQAVVP